MSAYVPSAAYRRHVAAQERRLSARQTLAGVRQDGDFRGLTMIDWATGGRVPYDPELARAAVERSRAWMRRHHAAIADHSADYEASLAEWAARHPPKRRRGAKIAAVEVPPAAPQASKPARKRRHSAPRPAVPAAPVEAPAARVAPADSAVADLAASIVGKTIWFLSGRSGRIERLI